MTAAAAGAPLRVVVCGVGTGLVWVWGFGDGRYIEYPGRLWLNGEDRSCESSADADQMAFRPDNTRDLQLDEAPRGTFPSRGKAEPDRRRETARPAYMSRGRANASERPRVHATMSPRVATTPSGTGSAGPARREEAYRARFAVALCSRLEFSSLRAPLPPQLHSAGVFLFHFKGML